jgi:hypothetical protein
MTTPQMISHADLHMMVSALFSMIGQESAEPGAPADEPKLWSMIAMGEAQEIKLVVGANQPMLNHIVLGFGGEEMAEAGPSFEAEVMKEVANVIGGNLRGALGLGGALGLPSVVGAPAEWQARAQCFETWDGEARLSVWLEGVEIDG